MARFGHEAKLEPDILQCGACLVGQPAKLGELGGDGGDLVSRRPPGAPDEIDEDLEIFHERPLIAGAEVPDGLGGRGSRTDLVQPRFQTLNRREDIARIVASAHSRSVRYPTRDQLGTSTNSSISSEVVVHR